MATTLAADQSATARTVTLAAALSAATEGEYLIQIGTEYQLVEKRGNTTAPQVRRGVYGTTAAAHSSGAAVTLVRPQVFYGTIPAPVNTPDSGGGSGDSFPDAWTVGVDGSLIIDDRDGFSMSGPNPIFKVTPDTVSANAEAWASTLRVYNQLIVDDAPMVAKNDDGDTFFELDPSANAGAGAVKVHGAEITDGADGASGTSFLTGAGVPDNTTDGTDGDSYLDTETGDIYGPKAGGLWGDPTPLTVPAVVPDTAYDGVSGDATLVQGSGTAVLNASDVRIKRLGREVHARVYVLVDTATGEPGEPWLLTMPVAFPAAENTNGVNGPYVAGCGYIIADGTALPVTVVWTGAPEGARGLKVIGPAGEVGTDMDLQLLDGAELQFNLVYEAAEAAA